MVCIGIPVCRPLYRQYLDRLTSNGSHGNRYQKQGSGIDSNGTPLRTFGGSTMPGNLTDDGEQGILSSPRGGRGGGRSRKSAFGTTHELYTQRDHALGSQITRAYAMASSGKHRGDTSSDEEVLAHDYKRQQQQHLESQDRDRSTKKGGNIRVTEEFSVTTE
jgi:hypothetical protein